MTEAMPFLQKYDITFLRPPAPTTGELFCSFICKSYRLLSSLSIGTSPR